ncbi:Rap1a/Tai family immunity protein [Agarivorans sp. 1_MG-2023]|uniref:Rap1a/Tai family immunity protein n=1 Tax=Agarivorans sp. 1_MG-2023 TaxID=3062634 RepID=UPI0026E1333A|nr:Rap1a/Tai family immunity protein [Agarivorans sp. 1_MG-2023]MDO6766069.1 Rap1a/Tai family immunity protein [Agarivorans sp. 1_MG-2023]
MKFLLTIVLCIFISNSYAGDGHSLKESCVEAEKLWSGKLGDKEKGMYCIGLLKGIVSVMTITANSSNKETANHLGMCNSAKPQHFISTEQSITTVLKFLYTNPDKLEQQDFVIALKAMKKDYPCTK